MKHPERVHELDRRYLAMDRLYIDWQRQEPGSQEQTSAWRRFMRAKLRYWAVVNLPDECSDHGDAP